MTQRTCHISGWNEVLYSMMNCRPLLDGDDVITLSLLTSLLVCFHSSCTTRALHDISRTSNGALGTSSAVTHTHTHTNRVRHKMIMLVTQRRDCRDECSRWPRPTNIARLLPSAQQKHLETTITTSFRVVVYGQRKNVQDKAQWSLEPQWLD